MPSNIVYHLTPTRNVPHILRKGLYPGKAKGLTEPYIGSGHGSFMRGEKSHSWFVQDLEDLKILLHTLGGRTRRLENYTVLGVSLPPNIKMESDYSCYPVEFIGTKRRISPRYIRVVGSFQFPITPSEDMVTKLPRGKDFPEEDFSRVTSSLRRRDLEFLSEEECILHEDLVGILEHKYLDLPDREWSKKVGEFIEESKKMEEED